MPQVRINNAELVSMAPNIDNFQNSDMVLNLCEEEWFKTLDRLNPDNIIKYLDIRHIPHREAMQINLYMAKNSVAVKRNLVKILRIEDDYNELLKKYYELKSQLDGVRQQDQ